MRLATAFDGQFYPARRDQLLDCVDAYLDEAPQPGGQVLGVVVPHAGYVYSGRTAGRAIGMLRGDPPEAVLVLGPSHRVYFDGVRVFELQGYETPMGPMAADPELAREIAQGLGPETLVEGFPEHSVEVQLPLLARALPGVPVVEIVFGVTDRALIERAAEHLLALGRRHRLVIVASSDLSHYHDAPHARVLDGRFRELLEAGDPVAMERAFERGETEACGSGPVLTLMEMARRTGASIRTVEQTDSSEASGDESRVVGYLSAVALIPGTSA